MEKCPGTKTSKTLPKNMKFNARQFHDGFATLVHFISLWFFIDAFQSFPSPAVVALLVMQAVSFTFHASYIYFYYYATDSLQILIQPQNRLKWLEYGVSATAGSVAIIYSSKSPLVGFLVA